MKNLLLILFFLIPTFSFSQWISNSIDNTNIGIFKTVRTAKIKLECLECQILDLRPSTSPAKEQLQICGLKITDGNVSYFFGKDYAVSVKGNWFTINDLFGRTMRFKRNHTGYSNNALLLEDLRQCQEWDEPNVGIPDSLSLDTSDSLRLKNGNGVVDMSQFRDTSITDGLTIFGSGVIGDTLKVDTAFVGTRRYIDSLFAVKDTTLIDGLTIIGSGVIGDTMSVDTSLLSTIGGFIDTLQVFRDSLKSGIFDNSGTATTSNTWNLGTTNQFWNTSGLLNTFVIDGTNGRIGIGQPVPLFGVDLLNSKDGIVGIRILNSSATSSAESQVKITNDVGKSIFLRQHSSVRGVSSLIGPNVGMVYSETTTNMFIGASGSGSGLGLFAGGPIGGNVGIYMKSGKIGLGNIFNSFGTPQVYIHTNAKDAASATTFEAIRFNAQSDASGTSIGFGMFHNYQMEVSNSFNRDAMHSKVFWTDPTDGSQDATYQLWLSNNGTIDTVMTVDSDGFIKPISGIIDSDGDKGTLDQVFISKVNGLSDWVDSGFNTSLTGDKRDISALVVTTAGSFTVTHSGCPFLGSGDIGKTIIVYGAGDGLTGQKGDELITTIVSAGSCSAVLADSATVTTSNSIAFVGTNNTPILESIIDNNKIIKLPISGVGNNYLFSDIVNFDTLTNTGLVGAGDSLFFVSAEVGSYPYDPAVPARNLFHLQDCDNVTFEDFVVINIGQTFSRVDTLEEDGYWSVLNGVTTPYNRHYNKQSNNGAVIDFTNTKNVNVRNITGINIGSLVRAFGGGTPYENSHLTVKDCHVYGWGGTAIYPSDFSTIEDNHFDNEVAPVINSTDQALLLGSSHVLYSTAGYKEIIFNDNMSRFCRGTAIQWNTNSGRSSENNVVNGNTFYECSRAGSLIGNSDVLQINFTGNSYYKCGRWLVTAPFGDFNFVGETWDSTYSGNNDFEGAFNILGSKSISISDSKFSRITTSGNVAPLQFSGHSMQTNYKAIIDNCYFDSTNNRSIMFLVDHNMWTGTLTIKNSEIYAPIYLMGTLGLPSSLEDPNGIDKFFISNNDFFVKGNNAIVARFGATINNNRLYQTDANYAIEVDMLTGGGYMNIHENSFYNRGGSNMLLLSTSAANQDSVSFLQNHIYGTNTITLNSKTLKVPSNNFINGNVVFDLNNNVFDSSGTGTPEGVVTAGIGSMYIRTDGGAGTSRYFKESGTGNTGWIPK